MRAEIIKTYGPIALVATAVCCIVLTADASGAEAATIKPDPTIKAKIQDVTAAIRTSEQGGDSIGVFRAIIALKRATRENPGEVVRQLIWHLAQATDDVEKLTFPVVLGYVRIPTGAMIDAVAPLSGRVEDAKLKEGVELIARSIENGNALAPADLTQYRGHVDGILQGKIDNELGLVDHMYRRSPGDALQVFVVTAYHDERVKPILWARHVVDDLLWKREYAFVPRKQTDAAVTEQLEKMAGREEWWARLYAAEIIRQHPELGTAELIERLRADSHPSVKETPSAIRP